MIYSISIFFFGLLFIVCVEVKYIKVLQSSHKWEIGSCSSIHPHVNPSSHRSYFERCCLKPGTHTLTCWNLATTDNWRGNSVVIQGQRYCDDFIGYRAMRKIHIFGKIAVIPMVIRIEN